MKPLSESDFKSLTEYVLKTLRGRPASEEDVKYEYPRRGNCETFDSFMEENNVDEDTVTEDMIEWFATHVCEHKGYYQSPWSREYYPQACVNEMLEHTPPISKLINRLNSELGGGRREHIFRVRESDYITLNDDNPDIFLIFVPKKMYKLHKIEHIADSMMYFCTSVWHIPQKNSDDDFMNPHDKDFTIRFENDNGIEFTYIKIEPVKARKCTDYVRDDCNGILYHVTTTDKVSDILRTGLRMKGEKNDYRFIKNRVYFAATSDDNKLKQVLEQIIGDINMPNGETYVILKIDASDYNVDFYKDLMYKYEKNDECYVYAHTYFPPKLITDVTKELKEKLNL